MKLSSSSLAAPTVSAIALRLLVILLIAAAGYGQTDSNSGPPRHSVRGTVVNSVTGTPIARAVVTMSGDAEPATMTDANGAFRFEGIPEGQERVVAERPGFFPVEEGGRLIGVSGDVEGLAIPLAPQAVISGRIASLQNVALEDLPIHLFRRTYNNGRAQWQLAAMSTSDDDGQFRFGGLQPGAYSLSVGPENWRPRAAGSRPHGYTQVFYPNAPDFSSASMISLTAGQQAEANFSLSPEPLFEISGQIAGGPPGLESSIQMTNNAGDSVPVQLSGARSFSTFVPAGTYLLSAAASNETVWLQGSIPVAVAGNMAGIQVTLAPRSSISVNVRSEGNEPSAGRASLSETVRVMLTPPVLGLHGQLWAQPISGQRGRMEIYGAEPGPYSVEITAYGKYVVSATSGSTNLLTDPLVVSNDGQAEPIEIVLATDGGQVTGSVQSSEPVNGATVLLIPDRSTAAQVLSANLSGSGDFQFEQVRPGNYSLLALENGEEVEYQNPEALSRYLSRATQITVASKQQVQASLQLIPAEK
ncbi:MAG TPA: carboxypeptidase-like regulatory domain-containing protein [Terriglobales bacterium]|nr:carboxypeptidase-like regulatory domain-containing protein [Terriglobales bacterium]